jgi:hypothetical protein
MGGVMTGKTLGFLFMIFVSAIPSVTCSDFEITFTTDYFSDYIWRGQKLSRESVIQPSFGFSFRDFGIELWGNYDTATTELNEIDSILSWTHTIHRLEIESGYIHYDPETIPDSDEIYATLRLKAPVIPVAAIYYDFTEGSGLYFEGGLELPVACSGNYSIEFAGSARYLLNNSYVAVDDQGREFRGFFDGELSAFGLLEVNDRLAFGPSVAYTFALTEKSRDAIQSASDDDSSEFFRGGLTLQISL